MPDGRIEPRQVERFREIGRWLGKYGESIYGTRGGPYIAPDEKIRGHGGYYSHFQLPTGRWWGGSTHKDNTVYLHVLRWPADEIVLPNIGAAGPPAGTDRVLSLLSYSVLTGGEAVVTQDDCGIRVSVPAEQRDPLDTIVKLQFDRSVVGIEPVRTGPPPLVHDGRATASGVWPDPRLGPELAFDDDPSTRWGGAPESRDGWLAIELAEPRTFGRVRISEAYDRIQKFEIQIQQDGQWRTIHAGTTVGGNFSATFDPVTAQHVRLNILEATHVPTIWEVQLLAE
jgi:alpha-L-fucosidase